MAFFSSAINILQTLVVAIGAGLGVWGVINLMEGYGNDNPGAKSQGIKSADERWWCYPDRNTADPASEWIIWLRERSRDPCSVRFLMRLRNG